MIQIFLSEIEKDEPKEPLRLLASGLKPEGFSFWLPLHPPLFIMGPKHRDTGETAYGAFAFLVFGSISSYVMGSYTIFDL